jgi:5-hydroxyisourate hydrolase-like protein (transthyretin family)
MKASKNSIVKINSNKKNNNQKTENQIWQTMKLKKKSYKLFKIKQIVTKEHVSNMNKKQIEGVLWDFTRVSVRIEDEKEKKKATNTKQEVH